MAALGRSLSNFFKWNPLTAAPYAALDHVGGVEAAKKAIDPTVPVIAPPMIPAPPVKTGDPAAVAAAAELARRRTTKPAGRSSTLLTGPSGLTGSAPTQRKTLLGL